DEPHHHIRAPLVAAPPLVLHGERLAHARRGAEIDAQAPTPGGGRGAGHALTQWPSRARFSSRTFTPGSPKMAHCRPLVCLSIAAITSATFMPRAAATLAAWSLALA